MTMIKKITIAILIALGILAGLLAIALGPKFVNMKSEYVTARVIRNTHNYVVKTSGQWPQTWKDLGQPDLSRYTHMDFAINPKTASESEILKAITPQSKKYLTYPHSEDDLKALYAELRKQHSNKVQEDTAPKFADPQH